MVLLRKDCDWEQEAPPPAPPEMALAQEPVQQEPRTAWEPQREEQVRVEEQGQPHP